MAQDPRERFLQPIMQAVDRGIYDVIDSAGNATGIRAEERQDIGQVAKNFINRMNNEVGFALREQGMTEEEALEAMLGVIYETQAAMQKGGPESLVPGRHFYLNPEDY